MENIICVEKRQRFCYSRYYITVDLKFRKKKHNITELKKKLGPSILPYSWMGFL